ncbi:hypothetical protein EDC01DRAFT_590263, partial [Geopyxis carbonaria]
AIDPMEILRQHFETQFEPLPVREPVIEHKYVEEHSDHEFSSGEWEGFSDDENGPEIVEHNYSEHENRISLEISKAEAKAFMSSKFPKNLDAKVATPSTGKKSKKNDQDSINDTEDATSEAENLKKDMALQRLLRESHLLDSTSTSFEATGKNRLKAIESRLESLGGKPRAGQKMSMALKKGIDEKKSEREKKRRAEARENGIVLEKEERKSKTVVKRDRGFAPLVGKFKGGALVLSQHDVKSIEGHNNDGRRKNGR